MTHHAIESGGWCWLFMSLAVPIQEFLHRQNELLGEQIKFLSDTHIVLEVGVVEDEELARGNLHETVMEVMVDHLSRLLVEDAQVYVLEQNFPLVIFVEVPFVVEYRFVCLADLNDVVGSTADGSFEIGAHDVETCETFAQVVTRWCRLPRHFREALVLRGIFLL